MSGGVDGTRPRRIPVLILRAFETKAPLEGLKRGGMVGQDIPFA